MKFDPEYIGRSYIHLIPRGTYVTSRTFAQLIAKQYDMKKPRNKEAFDMLNEITGEWVRFPNGNYAFNYCN